MPGNAKPASSHSVQGRNASSKFREKKEKTRVARRRIGNSRRESKSCEFDRRQYLAHKEIGGAAENHHGDGQERQNYFAGERGGS